MIQVDLNISWLCGTNYANKVYQLICLLFWLDMVYCITFWAKDDQKVEEDDLMKESPLWLRLLWATWLGIHKVS